MTTEQITIECAKLDEFEEIWQSIANNNNWYGYKAGTETRQVPNYTTSRDAIVPLIEKQHPNVKCKFVDELEQIIRRPENAHFGDKLNKKFPLNHFGKFAVITATPLQLCEALLRALDKWKD